MENIIYYFSGTGNSLMTAKVLAKKLKGETEIRALTNYLDREEIVADATETVGFVFPIYGGDAPWPVKMAAEKMRFPKGVYLYGIGTCNERGGHCMDIFNGLLIRRGYALAYAKTLDMPGNCMESNERENKERLRLMDSRIALYAENINNRFHGTVANYDSPENTASQTKERYQGRFAGWLGDLDRCVSCGICEKLCPMGNIRMENGLPVFGDNCAFCFGCFHFCPQGAVYKESPGFGLENRRSQYHHPDVSWQDIGKQQERR